jgi:hypothetical protein
MILEKVKREVLYFHSSFLSVSASGEQLGDGLALVGVGAR